MLFLIIKMSSSYKVSPISTPMKLGEGPHWIEKDKSLIFVDYPSGNLNRIFIETQRHQVMDLGKFILFMSIKILA